MPATWLATRDVPLAALRRFPGNARRGNIGEIRKSIRRHGQYRALVVREHDGGHTILAGNHTAAALEAEGYATARCGIIRCTDDEAVRINLADNRLSDIAADDPAALVTALAALGSDYEGTGWAEEDVSLLTTEPVGHDGTSDPDPPGDQWATLRFRVPPDVRAEFLGLTAGCAAPGDDSARFMFLVGKMRGLA